MRIDIKQTGSSLTATEFNQIPYEVQNAINNAGLNPSASVLTQLSQAISQMVTDANFFSTSGTESNIILTANAPRLAPTRLTDGMMVRFRALYSNGANTTVNLNNLGAKNVQIDGENISAGEFEEGKTYILTYVQSTDTFELFQSGGGGEGSEIGDIGIAFLGIDETQNKRRYLNGQVIMQSEFEAFTNWVKEKILLYPNAVCSETEWQNEVQTSVFHQCGKVVINDEDGTIRLPKVVNIQGCQDLANNLGVILSESLPNINGYIQAQNKTEFQNATGAFKLGTIKGGNSASFQSGQFSNIYFDASLSSSTYQDNAPVQQEAIQYPFYIQVAKGGKKSVDTTEEYTINNPFSLFDCQYDYKERQNSSWLLSNGQRNDGSLYADAYQELLRVYGTTEKKIGLASVKLISDSSATDYDFKIDTSSQEFILPTKVQLAGGKAVVGDGSIPSVEYSTSQAFSNVNNANMIVRSGAVSLTNITGNYHMRYSTDSTKSGLELSDSNLYLYYYVGETVENPNLINAGQVMNALSKKVDLPTATASSFPSSRYIDLTFGASGTTYTAPANGWFCAKGGSTSGTKYITMTVGELYVTGMSPAGISNAHIYIPAKKGDIMSLQYSTNTANSIKFIYAEGEQ